MTKRSIFDFAKTRRTSRTLIHTVGCRDQCSCQHFVTHLLPFVACEYHLVLSPVLCACPHEDFSTPGLEQWLQPSPPSSALLPPSFVLPPLSFIRCSRGCASIPKWLIQSTRASSYREVVQNENPFFIGLKFNILVYL